MDVGKESEMKKKCGCLLLSFFLIPVCYVLVDIIPEGRECYFYYRSTKQERQAYKEIVKFGGYIRQINSETLIKYETGEAKPRWSIHLGGTKNKSILPLKSSLEILAVKDLWLDRGELLTDEELRVVENLDQLNFLDLGTMSAVTDESIPMLKELPRLRRVQARGSRMTKQAFDLGE